MITATALLGPLAGQATAQTVSGGTYGATQLPKSPTGRTYQVPATIPADCTGEVTAALNTFLATVPDNSTVSFPAGGCYHVEGVVVVDQKHTFAVVGHGAQLVARTDATGRPVQVVADDGYIARNWPRGRKQLLVSTSSDVTISGLTIHGPNSTGIWNPTFGDQDAIAFFHVLAGLVNGNSGGSVYGDFVAIGADSSQITVENNTIVASGRGGISSDWASYLTEQHNTFTVKALAFDIEPINPGWRAEHILLTHNIINGGLFFSNVGSLSAPSGDIEVSYNVVHGSPIGVQIGGGGKGDPMHMRYHYRIIGNTSDTPIGVKWLGLMTIDNAADVRVEGNTQPFVPSKKGQWTQAVVISNTINVTAVGNRFANVTQVIAPGNSGPNEASTALTEAAQVGALTITVAGRFVAMEMYQIGTGSSAEVFSGRKGCGTSPCTYELYQPLAHAQPVGAPVVSAPNR